MNKKDKILLRIKEVVNRTAPNSDVFLYGSRARGDSKAHSDWDLLILLNSKNISFAFETRFMNEFYELEMETVEVFTPLIFSKSDWNKHHIDTPLYENIKKEAIKLK